MEYSVLAPVTVRDGQFLRADLFDLDDERSAMALLHDERRPRHRRPGGLHTRAAPSAGTR